MSLISKRNIKPGNVVKAELLPSCGYARKSIEALLDSSAKIGDVYALSGGSYVPVAVGTETESLAVIIGTEVYDLRPTDATTVEASVPAIVRGAIVGDLHLNVGLADKDVVIATLEAQGVLVETQV